MGEFNLEEETFICEHTLLAHSSMLQKMREEHDKERLNDTCDSDDSRIEEAEDKPKIKGKNKKQRNNFAKNHQYSINEQIDFMIWNCAGMGNKIEKLATLSNSIHYLALQETNKRYRLTGSVAILAQGVVGQTGTRSSVPLYPITQVRRSCDFGWRSHQLAILLRSP